MSDIIRTVIAPPGEVSKAGSSKAMNLFIDPADDKLYGKDFAGVIHLIGGGGEQVSEIDCSTNPYYPAALEGEHFIVSGNGKIGGASGIDVTIGDAIIAIVDSPGGDQATVGDDFDVVEGNMFKATQTETNSGTDDEKYLVPKKFRGGIQDILRSGYDETVIVDSSGKKGTFLTIQDGIDNIEAQILIIDVRRLLIVSAAKLPYTENVKIKQDRIDVIFERGAILDGHFTITNATDASIVAYEISKNTNDLVVDATAIPIPSTNKLYNIKIEGDTPEPSFRVYGAGAASTFGGLLLFKGLDIKNKHANKETLAMALSNSFRFENCIFKGKSYIKNVGTLNNTYRPIRSSFDGNDFRIIWDKAQTEPFIALGDNIFISCNFAKLVVLEDAEIKLTGGSRVKNVDASVFTGNVTIIGDVDGDINISATTALFQQLGSYSGTLVDPSGVYGILNKSRKLSNCAVVRDTIYAGATPLTDAKAAAVAGDTIVVYPGVYSDGDLLKNNVNWKFLDGAIIEADDIFHDTAGAVDCKIEGGVFRIIGVAQFMALINSSFVSVNNARINGQVSSIIPIIKQAGSSRLELFNCGIVAEIDAGVAEGVISTSDTASIMIRQCMVNNTELVNESYGIEIDSTGVHTFIDVTFITDSAHANAYPIKINSAAGEFQMATINIIRNGADFSIKSASPRNIIMSSVIAGIEADNNVNSVGQSMIITSQDYSQRKLEDGITANVGGGQAGAYQLSRQYNIVNNVATNDDSIKAVRAIPGRIHFIDNVGTKRLNLFPLGGDKIEALAINDPLPIAKNKCRRLVCQNVGEWKIIGESRIEIAKTLFVTPNGDDVTAIKGDLHNPYLTINAAKNAAISGDVIHVFPGTYDEKNLLKNGVDYYFEVGVKVISTDAAAGAIFDDSVNGANVAVTCQIKGYGEFVRSNTVTWHSVFYLDKASNINIECNSLEGTEVSPIQVNGTGATIFNVHAHEYIRNISANTADCVELHDCTAKIKSKLIESLDGVGISIDNSIVIIEADKINSGLSCINGGDSSECDVYVKKMTSTGSSFATIALGGVSNIYDSIIKSTATGAGVKINGLISVPVGADMTFYNCIIIGESYKAIINSNTTGKITMYGGKLINLANDANAHGILVINSPVIIINNLVIVTTHASSNSIYSVAANNVIVYGGYADKAVHANIIQKVSSLTISTDVI